MPPNDGAVIGDVAWCRARCDTTVDCHSFSYSATHQTCYLKRACFRGVPKMCSQAGWQTHYYPCFEESDETFKDKGARSNQGT